MPRWDEPTPAVELAWVVADLDAARGVLHGLPDGSRDRRLLLAAIADLQLRLEKLRATLSAGGELASRSPRRTQAAGTDSFL